MKSDERTPVEIQRKVIEYFRERGKASGTTRRKRDHQLHTLDHYFRTHLSWLTEVQKEELKALKASSSSETEIRKKVDEFYEQLAGEAKEKARAQLKNACRDLVKWAFGDEQENELKQMHESRASVEEIAKKITDEIEIKNLC